LPSLYPLPGKLGKVGEFQIGQGKLEKKINQNINMMHICTTWSLFNIFFKFSVATLACRSAAITEADTVC